MRTDFPRIISLLRKERGISQKFAASELGISQALLSHYEKGIRECGLDFLVRIADYYGVSCDYLLGRSPEPDGLTLMIEDIPENDTNAKERVDAHGIIPTLNKKLISNSLNIIFSLLQKSKNPTLIKEVSSFLMLSVYRSFRIIFSVNPKNDRNFFTVPEAMASNSAQAAMAAAEAKAQAAAAGILTKGVETIIDRDSLHITNASLSEEYKPYVTSLLNLVQNSEVRIHLINNAEK